MEHEHHHEHHHEQHDNDHGNFTPKEELIALMKYMVDHNEAHAKELMDLAKQLEEQGCKDAFDKTMLAVKDFDNGNAKLREVLKTLE